MWPWQKLIAGRKYTKPGSAFGYRIHPIKKTRKFHNGIDLASLKGKGKLKGGEGIHAAAHGVVKEVGYDKGRGKFVILGHDDGYESHYYHMSAVDVKKGDKIGDGNIIGGVGTTGASTGNHLHYGISKNGKFLDPESIGNLETLINPQIQDDDIEEFYSSEEISADSFRNKLRTQYFTTESDTRASMYRLLYQMLFDSDPNNEDVEITE